MALYARDVLAGALPGPHSDTDAERFARQARAKQIAEIGPVNSAVHHAVVEVQSAIAVSVARSAAVSGGGD